MTRTVLLVLFLGSLAAGCSLIERIPIDQSDLSARCAEAMQQAFPGGKIKITSEDSHADTAQNYATIVSRVVGERQDVAADAPDHQIAAQCRYENGIMTGFAWTQAPERNATTGP
jgi:hypothetical protein